MSFGIDRLIANAQPVEAAPKLRTVNGFGCRLLGSLTHPGMSGHFVACYWIVVFFLPIVPLQCYIVSRPSGRPASFYFHAKVTWGDVIKSFGWRTLWLVGRAWLEGIIILAFLLGVLFLWNYLRSS